MEATLRPAAFDSRTSTDRRRVKTVFVCTAPAGAARAVDALQADTCFAGCPIGAQCPAGLSTRSCRRQAPLVSASRSGRALLTVTGGTVTVTVARRNPDATRSLHSARERTVMSIPGRSGIVFPTVTRPVDSGPTRTAWSPLWTPPRCCRHDLAAIARPRRSVLTPRRRSIETARPIHRCD